MLSRSLYHRSLRVSALLVAFALVVETGVFFPETEQFSLSARSYMANVIGISASVESTELSMMTAELTERLSELDQREATLSQREIELDTNPDEAPVDYSDYILSAILLLLLILIITNYIFDFLRARQALHTTYAQ